MASSKRSWRKENTKNTTEEQRKYYKVSNAYDSLAVETHECPRDQNVYTRRMPKSPPTFIHGAANYTEMITRMKEVAGDEQYYTKILTNYVIKINCSIR